MIETGIQILGIVLLVIAVRRYKISGQKVAMAGFILLFITMIFSLFHNDTVAGKIAEYVWILFAFAFLQQFIHYLKYENK